MFTPKVKFKKMDKGLRLDFFIKTLYNSLLLHAPYMGLILSSKMKHQMLYFLLSFPMFYRFPG